MNQIPLTHNIGLIKCVKNEKEEEKDSRREGGRKDKSV